MARGDHSIGTLTDLLLERARQHHGRRLYTFLVDGDDDAAHVTYGELDQRARAIAAHLQGLAAPGERAVLLYPPGPDYITGFFGCLYAGIVAVPVYPPSPSKLERTLPRLQAILASSGARVALTTTDILTMAAPLLEYAPDLAALEWLASDAIPDDEAGGWRRPDTDPGTLAFLQYTSGSTGTPRGVMLSHANLMANEALIAQAFEISDASRVASWLPPYHDMGLIGTLLQPLFSSAFCVLMPPVAFLQRPLRWLRTISDYRITASGGPNFAYDLCVRKVKPEQLAELDLSCWTLAFNGAEPVRAETLDRFAEAFAPCGFRREAFYPSYGLAEATLLVTGGHVAAPPVTLPVRAAALEQHRVEPAGPGEPTLTLVGCGHARAGTQIAIVDPELRTPCPPGQIGEVWVAGASVAQGYWGEPEETARTLRARLADGDEGPFLRTGDLGFCHDGELFITGRLKDLIIVDGRNLYPQDIEAAAEASHAALRPGCSTAFGLPGDDGERLVVVAEVERSIVGLARQRGATGEPAVSPIAEITAAVRRAISEQFDARVEVVLLRPGGLPKTSSGKVQRRACRAALAAGTLERLEV